MVSHEAASSGSHAWRRATPDPVRCDRVRGEASAPARAWLPVTEASNDDRNQIILTPKDFALLESMLRQRGGRSDPLGAKLARKLDAAIVIPASQLEPDVATLNCRLRFRVNHGRPEERILVAGPSQ